MSEMLNTEDWKQLRKEWAEFRRERANDRTIEIFNYLIENCPEVRAHELTPYQIRIEFNEQKLDFYPQKLRLFNIKLKRWFTLNKNHWIRDIMKQLSLNK